MVKKQIRCYEIRFLRHGKSFLMSNPKMNCDLSVFQRLAAALVVIVGTSIKRLGMLFVVLLTFI